MSQNQAALAIIESFPTEGKPYVMPADMQKKEFPHNTFVLHPPSTYTGPLLPADHIEQRLKEECPVLNHLDLEKNGLVVAGGKLFNICAGIAGSRNRDSDVDLFLVGPKRDQEQIDTVIENFREACAKVPGGGYEVYTSLHYTINTGKVSYQLMGKQFMSIEDLLGGFDLGSSMLAYDGRQVWMTPRARLALEYGVNVLDLDKGHASYAHRIVKYFNRGVGLAIPGITLPEPKYKKIITFRTKNLVLQGVFVDKWLLSSTNPCLSNYESILGKLDLSDRAFSTINMRQLLLGGRDFYKPHFTEAVPFPKNMMAAVVESFARATNAYDVYKRELTDPRSSSKGLFEKMVSYAVRPQDVPRLIEIIESNDAHGLLDMIHQTFGFLNSIDMSEQSIIPWGAPGSPCNSAYPRVATVLADWVDPAWIDESNTK